ncbi:MAG: pentapeptide repeat-containing protein [Chitinophaga sp.]|uniref:pentapeptide repeat-containing protein n=1 Tax=Chitinophaga sp. TaxID=1869181 RepID=UPI0025C54C84|nr:pentapeptide repeat-containing protein [Chitinophaga sp.]MBV8252326.1 pentapeptide repeat-containing protein [Chitinophaga sp.]
MSLIAKPVNVIHSNESFSEDQIDEDFSHFQFTDCSAYEKVFTRCNFSFCVFQRSYFRKVRFIECNFTGAKFFDSNFRDANFERCKFHYSIWKFTLIQQKQVLNNLPEWPNVKVLLLQNHKANANSFGDVKAVRAYLSEEIEANKEHYRRAMLRNEAYYSSKYSKVGQKLTAIRKYYGLVIDNVIWGHGEKPLRVLFSIILLILLTAILQLVFSDNIEKNTLEGSFSGFMAYCANDVKAFIGIQGADVSDFVKGSLIIFRYVAFSLFVRILFNKFSWR